MNYESRAKETGRRIRAGRDKLGLSPEDFLEKIYMSRTSTKTLRAWEYGERFPDLNSLVRMADVFNCDVGYLLCDYEQRTQKIADVCAFTGLSEYSIDALAGWHKWGVFKEYAQMLDMLILDAKQQNLGVVKGKNYGYKDVLTLLHKFFSCKDTAPINVSGIKLTDRIVENAILMEVQQALVNFKEKRCKFDE